MACLNVRNRSKLSFRHRDVLGYLAGGVLLSVALIALYAFFVRSHAGQEADQLAYNGAEFGRRSVTGFTGRVLDLVPNMAVVLGVILTAIIALVRQNWRTLLVALSAAAAATASAQLLKHVLLTRPDLAVAGYAANSFPSGHTTVAAASALVVFLVASPQTRARVAAGGTAFAVLAGVATLANQWHRPSDAIAALLWVGLWGCIAGVVLEASLETRPHTVDSGSSTAQRAATAAHPPTLRFIRWITLGSGGVSAAAFIVTLVVTSNVWGSVGSVTTVVAYLGGITAIITTGLVLALTATRVFVRLP